METAVRELQVPLERRNVMDAIGQLAKHVEAIEQRLAPVLMPSSPPPADPINKSIKLGDHRVELAEFLFAQRSRINFLNDQLQQILNRCEL